MPIESKSKSTESNTSYAGTVAPVTDQRYICFVRMISRQIAIPETSITSPTRLLVQVGLRPTKMWPTPIPTSSSSLSSWAKRERSTLMRNPSRCDGERAMWTAWWTQIHPSNADGQSTMSAGQCEDENAVFIHPGNAGASVSGSTPAHPTLPRVSAKQPK